MEKVLRSFTTVNLIDKFLTIDLATTGAGSWRQGIHARLLKTCNHVNRGVSALDQIWLVDTEAGRYMVSLCFAILGFHNFVLIPFGAAKLQRLHINRSALQCRKLKLLTATRFRQLLRRIRFACSQLAIKAKITKIYNIILKIYYINKYTR